MTYENRPNTSVLENRVAWAVSTAKSAGATDQPTRGMYLLTDFGRKLLAMPEADALDQIKDIERERSRARRQKNADQQETIEEPFPEDSDVPAPSNSEETTTVEPSWEEELLVRLHELTPEGFEKFIIYLLKRYDLKLTHTGGSGDEGIDAIGMAPLSPVLSSRAAVQVKRYSPDGKPIGRDVVALFQRDAMTKGAERVILVTLSRFTDSARKAVTMATPTVDLIDGKRLAKLILDDGHSGVQLAPVVDTEWFNQFD